MFTFAGVHVPAHRWIAAAEVTPAHGALAVPPSCTGHKDRLGVMSDEERRERAADLAMRMMAMMGMEDGEDSDDDE